MKRSKKSKAILSVIMAAFICMAGGVTVFAYQPPSTITNKSTETATTTDFFIRKKPTFPEKLISDCFAVSDDGTVYDLCNVNENTKTTCNHDYSKPVKKTDHIKDGKGGCAVYVYSALKCTKCSDTKVLELENVVTYMSCPH